MLFRISFFVIFQFNRAKDLKMAYIKNDNQYTSCGFLLATVTTVKDTSRNCLSFCKVFYGELEY